MKSHLTSLCIILIISTASLNAAFTIPEYETYTMDNGLQVYLMKQSEIPMINISLVVKSGAIHDGNAFGLANLTAEALQFGSTGLTKTEIENKLAILGANLSSDTSREITQLDISFLNKDEEVLLPLFTNIVLKPAFNQVEFDKFQKRLLAQLDQHRESPQNIIADAFARFYFADHPYGNPPWGDSKSVSDITLSAVKAFYRKHYTPANSALIIVGDINPKAWKKKIRKLYSKWQGEKTTEKLIPLGTGPRESRVLLINKEDAIETTFMIGGKGISANHPDAVAVQVINTILGGRFTSWLNNELRVNSGLTYGARSHFNSYQYGGSFTISTFTKKSTTFDAIELTKKTYMRLWEKGIDEKTLNSAKTYVKGQFPPRYETSGQLSQLLAKMWALDLSDSFINDFEKNINSLDVAKANEIARKLFPDDNLQYVLVGKASDIKEQAKRYGKVTEVDIDALHF